MDKDMQALEEYKMLRAELMYYMNKDTTLLTCLFSAVTATLFFSVERNVREGCLMAFLIIIPICNKFAYHQKQMAKISTYMSYFLESGLEIKWETRVGRMSRMKKGRNAGKRIHGGSALKFSESAMMAIFALLCYVLLLCRQFADESVDGTKWLLWTESAIILTLFSLTLVMSWKIYRIQDYREKYMEKWKRLEEESRRG